MADQPDPHAVDDLVVERMAVGAWIPDQVSDHDGSRRRAGACSSGATWGWPPYTTDPRPS